MKDIPRTELFYQIFMPTVAKMVKDERAYHVFEELNTYTAVVYLQKVTHPSASAPAKA